jgi:hypothetical protein
MMIVVVSIWFLPVAVEYRLPRPSGERVAWTLSSNAISQPCNRRFAVRVGGDESHSGRHEKRLCSNLSASAVAVAFPECRHVIVGNERL